MKTRKSILFVTVILVAAYVLSACGSAPAASPAEQAAVKVESSLVAYTGTIESMNGNQWLVNGQTLTVAPEVVRDGPFQVGDTVKVEGNVNPDGSFVVSRVEAPSATDLTGLPRLGDDSLNANSNDDNSNDDDDNSNDDNINSNSNDDSNDSNTNSNHNNSNDDNNNANSNDDNNNNSNSNMNNNDDDNSNDSNNNDNDDDDKDDDGGNSNDDDD